MNQFGGNPFVGGGFSGVPQPFVQQPFPAQFGNPAAFANPMPGYQGANFYPNNGVAFPPAGFPAPQPAMGTPGQFGPAFPFPPGSPGGFGFPPAAPTPFAPPFPSGQFGAFPPPPPLIPENYFGSGAYGRPRSRHRSSSRRRRHHRTSSSSESDEPRRGSPFGGNPYSNGAPFGMNPPPVPPRVGSPFLPAVRPGW